MTEKCKAEIYTRDQWGSFHPHRCYNMAVKDGYCKTHNPDYVKAKNEKREKKWQADWTVKEAKWAKEKREKEAYPLLLAACKSLCKALSNTDRIHEREKLIQKAWEMGLNVIAMAERG